MPTTEPLPQHLPELHLGSMAYTAEHWMPRPARDAFGEHDPFDLDAPYQRGAVWTIDQQRALVKSLLMGLPIGSVIVSALPYREGREASYRVVDGKQRILAIRAWMGGQVDVPGWWFRPEQCEYRERDVTFPDLTLPGQRRFQNAMAPALQFDAERVWLGRDAGGNGRWARRTEAQMVVAEAELYLLINGGGTDQTDEDMARAARAASL